MLLRHLVEAQSERENLRRALTKRDMYGYGFSFFWDTHTHTCAQMYNWRIYTIGGSNLLQISKSFQHDISTFLASHVQISSRALKRTLLPIQLYLFKLIFIMSCILILPLNFFFITSTLFRGTNTTATCQTGIRESLKTSSIKRIYSWENDKAPSTLQVEAMFSLRTQKAFWTRRTPRHPFLHTGVVTMEIFWPRNGYSGLETSEVLELRTCCWM